MIIGWGAELLKDDPQEANDHPKNTPKKAGGKCVKF